MVFSLGVLCNHTVVPPFRMIYSPAAYKSHRSYDKILTAQGWGVFELLLLSTLALYLHDYGHHRTISYNCPRNYLQDFSPRPPTVT